MASTVFRGLRSYHLVFLLLLAMQLFNWLLGTTPHFNLPLGPELIIIGACLVFFALFRGDYESTLKIPPRNADIGIVSLVVGYMILTTLRAFISFKWGANPCMELWGILPRLECIFQADINQDSSLRLWLYAVTAMFLFMVSRKLSLRGSGKIIPGIILATCSLFAVISAVATGYGEVQFLPRFIMVNEFGAGAMTHLMQNPSWVWPYLLPGALSALYFVFTTPAWIKKTIYLLLFFFIVWVMLACRQRGALVCVSVLLFLSVAGLIKKNWRQITTGPWYIKILLAAIILASFLPIVSYFYFPQELVSILKFLGLGSKLSAKTVMSVPRLNIWKSALSGMDGYWLMGHGYASWFEFFKPLAIKDGHRQIYDTAHNFFVQSIFELGLIQTALIVSLFVWMVRQSILRSDSPSEQLNFVFISLGAYLTVLSVQEVDFIRSAYYQYALFWGWVLTPRHNFAEQGSQYISDQEQNQFIGGLLTVYSRARNKIKVSSVIFGSFLMAFGLGTFFWFSLAGYQFEADSTQGYNPKVRWLRSLGTLNSVQFGELPGIYALYPLLSTTSSDVSLEPSGSGDVQKVPLSGGAPAATDKYYLPIKIRSPLSLPDFFAANTNANNYGRDIAVLTVWPSVYTAIPLVFGQNLHEWEAVPGDKHKKIIWCKQNCTLQLLGCPTNQVRRLVLMGARPDISPLSPLITEFSIMGRPSSSAKMNRGAETPEAETSASATTQTGSLIFSHAQDAQFIDLEEGSQVSLSSQSVFSSQGDERSLGLLLWDSFCYTKL